MNKTRCRPPIRIPRMRPRAERLLDWPELVAREECERVHYGMRQQRNRWPTFTFFVKVGTTKPARSRFFFACSSKLAFKLAQGTYRFFACQLRCVHPDRFNLDFFRLGRQFKRRWNCNVCCNRCAVIADQCDSDT